MQLIKTEKNAERIQQIVKYHYKEKIRELNLSKFDAHSEGCVDDWIVVLEFRNWTALWILCLSKTVVI